MNKKQLVLSFIILVTCSYGLMAQETAKAAWEQLVGKTYNPEAYRFVKNNPKLPNVLIYGDSISIAYTPTVRKELAGKANVYRIFMNGVHSGHLIRCMKKMESVMRNKDLKDPWNFKWDIILFNVGLHDLRYDLKGGQKEHNASPRVYGKHLKKILKYFKSIAPHATIIFTTTTPVPKGSTDRVAGDAVIYNNVALAIMKTHKDIIINDLYSLTKPHHKEWRAGPGNDHFNYKGYTAQGIQTAAVILKQLSKKSKR